MKQAKPTDIIYKIEDILKAEDRGAKQERQRILDYGDEKMGYPWWDADKNVCTFWDEFKKEIQKKPEKEMK